MLHGVVQNAFERWRGSLTIAVYYRFTADSVDERVLKSVGRQLAGLRARACSGCGVFPTRGVLLGDASRQRRRPGAAACNAGKPCTSYRHGPWSGDRPANLLRPTLGDGDSSTLIKVTAIYVDRRYFTTTGQAM